MLSTAWPWPRSHFILTELLPFRRKSLEQGSSPAKRDGSRTIRFFIIYDVARDVVLCHPCCYNQNTISEGLNFKIFRHAPRPPYISAAFGSSPGYTLAHPIPKAVTRPCNYMVGKGVKLNDVIFHIVHLLLLLLLL